MKLFFANIQILLANIQIFLTFFNIFFQSNSFFAINKDAKKNVSQKL